MNTEQRLNELEKRVASLERMLATNLGQGSGVPQGQSQKPTPDEINILAKFITGQTTLPLEASQDKTGPPTWLGTSDTPGSDPDNTSGSDPAGQ